MENRKEFYDRDEQKYNIRKYGMNIKYGKHYASGKPKVKPYVVNKVKPYKHKRGMTKFEFMICWTLIWFLFIFGLAIVFNSTHTLWLLILWFFGIIEMF